MKYKFMAVNDLNKFDEFVISKSGPMTQLSAWAKVKTNFSPYFFCAFLNDEIVLSALVLERNIPFCGRLWYIPGGFVCDYENQELISEFYNFIKAKSVERKAFCVIVDPQIMKNKFKENPLMPKCDVEEIMKNAGFGKREGDNYTYQPPYTPAIFLTDLDSVYKKFEKGIKHSLKVGDERGVVCKSYDYDDINNDPSVFKDFLSVMNDTAGRVGFLKRPDEYYRLFIDNFKDYVSVDIVYYDKEKDIEQNEIKKMQKYTTKEEINSFNKYIELFNERQKEVNEKKIAVAAGLTIRVGKIAYCVFGGTKDILRNNLRSSQHLNYQRIKTSIEKGCFLHDMGRVPLKYADPQDKHNGLYKFKMSFGADFIEFIGEYVIVNKRMKYNFYYRHIPKLISFRFRLIRKIKNILRK